MQADQRPLADRPTPNNKLSLEERAAIMDLCNQTQYRSCPPTFIVADQMDQGCYLASESKFCRVMHEYDQVHHRGRQKAPERKRIATTNTANAPNQVWSWDVSCIGGTIHPHTRGEHGFLSRFNVRPYGSSVVGTPMMMISL